jgi:hypothetical protein
VTKARGRRRSVEGRFPGHLPRGAVNSHAVFFKIRAKGGGREFQRDGFVGRDIFALNTLKWGEGWLASFVSVV